MYVRKLSACGRTESLHEQRPRKKKTCATNASAIEDLIPELVDALPLMYANLKCDLNLYHKACSICNFCLPHVGFRNVRAGPVHKPSIRSFFRFCSHTSYCLQTKKSANEGKSAQKGANELKFKKRYLVMVLFPADFCSSTQTDI